MKKKRGNIGYYTIKQVANMYNVTTGCVYKWINKGLLDYIRPGREMFIPDISLDEFIKPKNGRPYKKEE